MSSAAGLTVEVSGDDLTAARDSALDAAVADGVDLVVLDTTDAGRCAWR